MSYAFRCLALLTTRNAICSVGKKNYFSQGLVVYDAMTDCVNVYCQVGN